jgi:hypothetical protein
MLPQSRTSLFFWTWKQTLHSWRKPITFVPLGLYATLQILLLIGLVFYMYPPFSFVFLPLHRLLFGEAALHYPNNFIVLPNLFEILNIILGGIMGIIVIAYSTLLFFAEGDRQAARKTGGSISKRYVHLFAAWTVETGLILFVVFAMVRLSLLFPSWKSYIVGFRVFVVLCVSAAFAFTTALILIEKKPFWKALPQSAKMFGSYAILLVLLVGIPTLIHLPLQFVLSNTAVVVRKLNPEVIAILIGAGVVASMFSNYLTIGTVTHLYRAIGDQSDALPLSR